MEQCQVCGTYGEDRRALRLQYFYDLSKASDKLVEEEVILRFNSERVIPASFYTITTCKDCRGDFIGLLRRWARGDFVNKRDDNPDYNIPCA